MFCEILKASKGLPVTDPLAALWGQKIAEGGAWQLTTITGTLPLTVLANGKALTDYKIYGTADGVGTETESGEPYGYKLHLTVTADGATTDYPVYIGDSQLMEEEYVSYSEQKVYRRTEQLYNFDAPDVEQYCYYNRKGVKVNAACHNESGFISVIAGICILRVDARITGFGCFVNFYDSNKNFVSNLAALTNPGGTYSITVPQDGYVRFNTVPERAKYTFVNGATAPQAYIPYYDPQDPPVPFPKITLPNGEATIDIEGNVKPQAAVIGEIKEI